MSVGKATIATLDGPEKTKTKKKLATKTAAQH